MGDFDSANLWLRLSLWMLDISIFLDLFAHAIGGFGASEVTSACLIFGFICVLVAVTLVQGLVFLDELKSNKPALICLIIFALLAGLCFAAGLALNIGYNDKQYSKYATNVMGWACLTALLGGIFAILEIAGVKA